MTTTTPLRRPRATSLIEVLVASSLLMVVVATTAAALAFSHDAAGRARQTAAAERIAATHIETLLLDNARGRIPERGTTHFNVEGQEDETGAFTSTWSLEQDKPIRGAARLAVEVGWQDRGQRTLRLVTYLGREHRP